MKHIRDFALAGAMRPADRWYSACLRLAGAVFLSVLLGAANAQAAQSSATMHALQEAHWVAEGSARPRHVLYIFIDANCPFCHKLWLGLQPYYRKGLQVRDLLVGVIAPSSPAKAAAIIDARDPAGALRTNELHWGSRSDGGGGIAPVAHPSDEDLRILAHNLALMHGFGFPGTPGLVYTDAQGQLHGLEGSPGANQLGQIVRAAAVPEH